VVVWVCGGVGGVVGCRVWGCGGVWVTGVVGVVGVVGVGVGVGGRFPLRSNIPRSALCATLDTYILNMYFLK
jgi:hypothetical protein